MLSETFFQISRQLTALLAHELLYRFLNLQKIIHVWKFSTPKITPKNIEQNISSRSSGKTDLLVIKKVCLRVHRDAQKLGHCKTVFILQIAWNANLGKIGKTPQQKQLPIPHKRYFPWSFPTFQNAIINSF